MGCVDKLDLRLEDRSNRSLSKGRKARLCEKGSSQHHVGHRGKESR